MLGSKILGWRTVCAVELAPFPRRVLLQRQADGFLDEFPIWDDIKTFDACDWQGHVDVVSGGFPCQPFSSASRGRRVAEDLWPQMLRVVRQVQPRWVFAENVQQAPIERACSDLHRLGFHARYCHLDAARLGAPHGRSRYWLAAHTHRDGECRLCLNAEVAGVQEVQAVDWWKNDPGSLGVSHGVANRMDRLAALGNGQVPAMAVAAWRVLTT